MYDHTSLDDWFRLTVAGGLTWAITVTVAFVIKRQLRAVLRLICGSDVGADFWTTFATVLTVFGPLLLVSASTNGAETPPQFVQRVVYLISLGIIGAFLAMGAAVMLSAPSQALSRRHAAQIAGGATQPVEASTPVRAD